MELLVLRSIYNLISILFDTALACFQKIGRRVLHADLGRAEADGICKIVLTKIFIMASRDGATVAGTDGSDFNHRESIASQYKVRYVT